MFMRADNGKELINDEVIKFCKNEGITIEVTAPYSPSQNGIAEHFNQTLIELVCAMLIAKGLPMGRGCFSCNLYPKPISK